MLAWTVALAVSLTMFTAEPVRADEPPPETSDTPEEQPVEAAPAPTDETAEPAAPDIADQPAQPGYDSLRNPFWPVGYSPPRVGEKIVMPKATEPVENLPEPPKWDEATKRLNIKGIMAMAKDSYMAVVNDQIVRENDIVMVVFDRKRYRWKVHAITKGGVRFEPLDVADAGSQAK